MHCAFRLYAGSGCFKPAPVLTTLQAAVSNTAGKDLLDQIQARGSITVAMEGTWAPWTYHDENDELVGYDVEVAKLIANELGVDVNFVEGEWDGLLAGLDDGRYDIMVNGVGVTPERQEKYDFPYLMPIIKLLSSSAATTTKFIPWRI